MDKKTSREWWELTKADPTKLEEWLIKQFRGEATAFRRISQFADRNPRHEKVLRKIAEQELQHSGWVLDLLEARGLSPRDMENAEKRYWKETLPAATDFEMTSAIAAHAEAMRLDRIRAIAGDSTAPADIRGTFKRILKDEIFHERAFRKMAGPRAMETARPYHERGMDVLGLAA